MLTVIVVNPKHHQRPLMDSANARTFRLPVVSAQPYATAPTTSPTANLFIFHLINKSNI